MINSVGGSNYSLPVNKVNRKQQSFQARPVAFASTENKQKKISFSEGLKIVVNGFVSQLKNMCESIIKHPIRTLVSAATVSGALMALPIIGIPTAVGGAALAIGFGVLGATKFVSNTAKAIKNSKNGEYDKARENLKSVGASTLDLALSLPFIPKALKSVKDFAKYGKIGVNHTLLTDLKSSKNIFSKFKTLNNANTELSRSINFQSVLDKKLETVSLSAQDKAILKQKMLKLNVSDDKFLDVVLDEYLKAKGTTARPAIFVEQTTKYDCGVYYHKEGKIRIKDYSKPDLPSTPSSAGKKIRKATLKNNVYECEVIDYKTGKVTNETISQKVWDDYNALDKAYAKLSPKAKQVSTIIHECEHMHQHGEVARAFGVQSCQNKSLMNSYVQQKGSIVPGSAEYAQAAKYKYGMEHYTSADPIPYLNNEIEVGARAAELRAIQSQEFQFMDEIFKGVDGISKATYGKAIIPAVVQANNAIS